MNTLKCEICGKGFSDTPKGYKAEYKLAAHRNTCFRQFKKKQRRYIRDYALNATDIEINTAYLFITNREQYLAENYSRSQAQRPTTPQPPPVEQSQTPSPEPSEDSSCEYEKEYLTDEFTSESDSDRASSASPYRPPSNELSTWIDDRSNLEYLVDKDDNIYLPNNKALLGKRNPTTIKKNDEIINSYKLTFV